MGCFDWLMRLMQRDALSGNLPLEIGQRSRRETELTITLVSRPNSHADTNALTLSVD